MNKKYIVQLTADERKDLENLLKKGAVKRYRYSERGSQKAVGLEAVYFELV